MRVGRRIVLASAVLVLLGACGRGGGKIDTAETAPDNGSGAGRVTTIPVEDRVAAPSLTGRTVSGSTLRLRDYRGKVVVLNVWNSTCGPCRAEAGALTKVAEETKASGVRFVGLNTRDYSAANARAFERRQKVPYPSWYDPDGKLVLRFPAGNLMPQGIPNTLVIDREGRIAARLLRAVDEEDLRVVLRRIMPGGHQGG
ncbi:TlpA disulfide reductase family protein [Streptomyces sp. 891-h]|uniref:TlpA family protein disulfide reductase n=1 Tax=unclassified Streptomyces TaxID=2593676 RepID=UPI001FA9CA6D|nr:TlpA disulfide reductase family protein [Streptomyces sp. 891-h]